MAVSMLFFTRKGNSGAAHYTKDATKTKFREDASEAAERPEQFQHVIFVTNGTPRGRELDDLEEEFTANHCWENVTFYTRAPLLLQLREKYPRIARREFGINPAGSVHSNGGGSIVENTLESVIDDFLESGSKSGNYRDALERVLTQWRQHLEDQGVNTVEDVSKRSMATYAQYLSGRVDAGKSLEADGEISSATAWTYYDYVSAFLSYCVRWEYLEENPARKEIVLDELPPRPKNEKRAVTNSSGRRKIGIH